MKVNKIENFLNSTSQDLKNRISLIKSNESVGIEWHFNIERFYDEKKLHNVKKILQKIKEGLCKEKKSIGEISFSEGVIIKNNQKIIKNKDIPNFQVMFAEIYYDISKFINYRSHNFDDDVFIIQEIGQLHDKNKKWFKDKINDIGDILVFEECEYFFSTTSERPRYNVSNKKIDMDTVRGLEEALFQVSIRYPEKFLKFKEKYLRFIDDNRNQSRRNKMSKVFDFDYSKENLDCLFFIVLSAFVEESMYINMTHNYLISFLLMIQKFDTLKEIYCQDSGRIKGGKNNTKFFQEKGNILSLAKNKAISMIQKGEKLKIQSIITHINLNYKGDTPSDRKLREMLPKAHDLKKSKTIQDIENIFAIC